MGRVRASRTGRLRGHDFHYCVMFHYYSYYSAIFGGHLCLKGFTVNQMHLINQYVGDKLLRDAYM